MGQISLRFATEDVEFSSHDFVLSAANKEAYDYLHAWPNWSNHCVIIHGPKASGKTHLAHMWCDMTDATYHSASAINVAALKEKQNIVIEDIETLTDKEALFHLYNHVKDMRGSLLLTASKPSHLLNIELKDLSSRLNASPAIAIQAPDDELLRVLLQKHFMDKQLRVSEEVIDYLLLRMERSYSAAITIAHALDAVSLEERRNITVPLAKKVLDDSYAASN